MSSEGAIRFSGRAIGLLFCHLAGEIPRVTPKQKGPSEIIAWPFVYSTAGLFWTAECFDVALGKRLDILHRWRQRRRAPRHEIDFHATVAIGLAGL